jgi:hypothetical protein
MNQKNSIRPKSRSGAITVPAIAVEGKDVYMMVLLNTAAKQYDLLGEDEIDLRFDDEDIVLGILNALMRYPKPERAFQLAMGDEPIEVEQVTKKTFRVCRRTKLKSAATTVPAPKAAPPPLPKPAMPPKAAGPLPPPRDKKG